MEALQTTNLSLTPLPSAAGAAFSKPQGFGNWLSSLGTSPCSTFHALWATPGTLGVPLEERGGGVWPQPLFVRLVCVSGARG